MARFGSYGLEHREKWYILLLKWVGIIFLSIIIIIGFFFIVMFFPEERRYYAYTDLDNNKGIAIECSYWFAGYKRGGQGSPVCELEDGTVIQVKQYKLIKVEEYVPIKEIIGIKDE